MHQDRDLQYSPERETLELRNIYFVFFAGAAHPEAPKRLNLFTPLCIFLFHGPHRPGVDSLYCGQLYDALKNLKITTRPSAHENNNEHARSQSAHLGLAALP